VITLLKTLKQATMGRKNLIVECLSTLVMVVVSGHLVNLLMATYVKVLITPNYQRDRP
jgi:hypothetical protein